MPSHSARAYVASSRAKQAPAGAPEAALDWLSERTRVTPTEWVLGIDARARALLSAGEAAESCYRDSTERLSRTRVRAQLARAHLHYGEWLRRERRRGEAREQLGTAHEMLDAMGMGAFAERARRELLATGETVRKRAVGLTAQQTQVARLARDGLSNPEIGARLFISSRTLSARARSSTTSARSSPSSTSPRRPAQRGPARRREHRRAAAGGG